MRPYRVLVVEPDQVIRESLMGKLQNENRDVYGVSTAREACVTCVTNGTPDCVIYSQPLRWRKTSPMDEDDFTRMMRGYAQIEHTSIVIYALGHIDSKTTFADRYFNADCGEQDLFTELDCDEVLWRLSQPGGVSVKL